MIIDINKIKLLLGIPTIDTSKDALITLMYNKAVSYCESYTQMIVEEKEIQKFFEGECDVILNLGTYPVNSIVEIKYNYIQSNFDDNYIVLDTKYYKLKKETGEVYIRTPKNGWQEYDITFNAGYDSTSCPNSLNDVLQSLTIAYYKDQNKLDTQGVKTESVNGDSITYFGNDGTTNIQTIINEINLKLDTYKVITF